MVRNFNIPGVKPPERECDDKNCPYHGNLSVRGRIMKGTVISAKMQRTATVMYEYVVKDRKYSRYERRRSKIHVHNPPCINAKEGDKVVIYECRPLAKTVAHVIVGILEKVT